MRPITKVLLAVLLGAILAAAGTLGSHGAAAATVQPAAVQVQGEVRTYSIYLPTRADRSRRYPVVMILHGGGGDGNRIAQQTGVGAYVDQGGFIAVFPDSGGREWSDGRETTRSGRDDVGFLVAIVRELVARHGADPARVFVGGASNGGMMVQRLACEATNIFAAYAVAIANMPAGLAGTCRPTRRVPIVFFVGTADPLMPWAGGEVRHGPLRGAGGRILSVPQTIDFWSRTDGCGAPRTLDLPDRAGDGTHARQHDYGSCGLIFYEIQGAGHTWPGGRGSGRFLAQRIVGNTTRAIDATAVMLEFFRRHGL